MERQNKLLRIMRRVKKNRRMMGCKKAMGQSVGGHDEVRILWEHGGSREDERAADDGH